MEKEEENIIDKEEKKLTSRLNSNFGYADERSEIRVSVEWDFSIKNNDEFKKKKNLAGLNRIKSSTN